MTAADPSVAPANWWRRYDRAWWSKDLVGGLAAGAVVIPQAMAYASIADLPAEIGLYTCMLPMVVYALLGGSRTLSVSTTSTIAVLTASTLVAGGVAAGTDDPARALATLTLVVGVILLVARVLRLGTLIDNISEATLTGVKVGVGLTVAAGQLPSLIGIESEPDADNFFSEMRAVVEHAGDTSAVTLAFSLATVAALAALSRWARGVPAPLVAVVGGILAVGVASLDDQGLALIEPVPSGLPTPVAPRVDGVVDMLPGALAIAVMVFLESAAVARSVRRREEPPIDNNRELVAAGAACIGGAFFRAMPSAGGFSQTATNVRAGARTQASALVTAALAVGCAMFLGGVLSDLPRATLGCLVVVAVIGLIEPADFVEYWRVNRLEFWLAVVTAFGGLVLGLLAAVFIGVVLTLLLVIVELDRIGVTELQPTRGDADVAIAGPDTAEVRGLLIERVDGPLYTANVRSVGRKLVAEVDRRADVTTLVVDATAVFQISVTVLGELAELERELAERGVELWLAGLPPHVVATLARTSRWSELTVADRSHATIVAALHTYRAAHR